MKATLAVTLLALVATVGGRQQLPTEIIGSVIEGIRDRLVNLNIKEVSLGESGTIRNLTIYNLDKFVVEILHSPILSSLIDNCTLSLSTASATADLDLYKFNVPGTDVILDGLGGLSGSADGMWATIALDVDLQVFGGIKIAIRDYYNPYIHVNSITPGLTGFNNAGPANDIIGSQLPDYLNANLANILIENKEAILDVINGALGGLYSY